MRCIQAGLDEVLAFWLGDERLQLCCRECVDESGFRDDEQEDLCASQRRELIGFLHDTCSCIVQWLCSTFARLKK